MEKKKYVWLSLVQVISRWHYNPCRSQTPEIKSPEEYTHLHYCDLECLSDLLTVSPHELRGGPQSSLSLTHFQPYWLVQQGMVGSSWRRKTFNKEKLAFACQYFRKKSTERQTHQVQDGLDYKKCNFFFFFFSMLNQQLYGKQSNKDFRNKHSPKQRIRLVEKLLKLLRAKGFVLAGHLQCVVMPF